jgi:hypothetical protein
MASCNTSEAKHTTSTENMLAQIKQLQRNQDLHLNENKSFIKMTKSN